MKRKTTNLTIEKALHDIAKNDLSKGHGSLSEYIDYLIEKEAIELRGHEYLSKARVKSREDMLKENKSLVVSALERAQKSPVSDGKRGKTGSYSQPGYQEPHAPQSVQAKASSA